MSGSALAIDLYLQPAGPAGSVLQYSAESGRVVRSLGSPNRDFVGSGGAMLAFGPERNLYGLSGSNIWVNDLNRSRYSLLANFSGATTGTPGGFTVGSDGTFYLQGVGENALIYVFHRETGQLTGNIGSPSSAFIGSSQANLTFGPDGNLYGLAGEEIWRYDFTAQSYSVVANFGAVSRSSPGGFTVGPDGTYYLQSVGPGGTISTFDGTTGELTGNLGSFDGGFIGSGGAQLTFGPRGKLYGISGTNIWVYDFATTAFTKIAELDRTSPAGFAVAPGPPLPEEINISRTSSLPEGRQVDMVIDRQGDVGELVVHFEIDETSTASPSDYEIITPDGPVTGDTFSVTIPDGVNEVVVELRATPDLLAEATEVIRLNILESPLYVLRSGSFREFDIFANGLLVTNTNARGEGSLRQAIANANNPLALIDEPLEILFSDALGVPFSTLPQTISLDGQALQLLEPALIKGPPLPGHVTLDANYESAVLRLSGTDGAVIENLTIARGTNTGGTHIAAGITINGGTGATLRNVTVRDCRDDSGAALEVASRDVFLHGCSIINNESAVSGGVELNGIADCEMFNCTISGNRKNGRGGAGILLNRGNRLRLTNVTVTDNVSGVGDLPGDQGGVGIGGEISDLSGMTLEITNSIVAGNRFEDGVPGDIFGTWVSGGNNLIGVNVDATGFGESDHVGTPEAPIDARLQDLSANGGTTLTHLPMPNSPAIDAGTSDANDEEFGQRAEGFLRVVGNAIDIGAVEVQSVLNLADGPREFLETDADSQPQIALQRAGRLDEALTFTWQAFGTGDSPTDGSDFVSGGSPTAAEFPSGEQTLQIAQIAGDNRAEPDEAFALLLTPATGEVGFGPSLRDAVFSLIDDDAAPVATDDSGITVVEDSLFAVVNPGASVLANDTDADDVLLQASLVSPPQNAESFSLNPDGTFAYQPERDFLGPDSFTYVATDGSNQSPPATVTIEVVPLVDLAVSIASSRDPVLAGLGLPGNLRHTITVTNHGPSDATNVVARVNRNGEDITLDIPSLAEGANADLEVVYDVVATERSGTITTAVSGFEIDQPIANTDDDTSQETTTVVSATDVATITVDPQPVLDRQSGLFLQSVRVTNNNAAPIPAFRVWIRSLPSHVVAYNAAGGVENGTPYLDIAGPFGADGSVELSLQFFSPDRDRSVNPNYEIELIESAPAAPVAEGERFAIERMIALADGSTLVEWPSQPGRIYHVEYSEGGGPWITVRPAIRAGANRIQWIDRGLPGTASHPSESSGRLYRVVDEGGIG